MVLSPQKLWESYDRKIMPLDISETGSFSTDFGEEKRVYFNGEATAVGCTRIYARHLLPKKQTNKLVIYFPEPEKDVHDLDLSLFIDKGWSVLAVDYAGNVFDRTRFTIYPATLKFADYNESELFSAPESPQKTCWYVWTTVCLRALTYAESQGYTRVALVGAGAGGSHVFKAAAISGFPLCAASLYSPVFFPSEDPQLQSVGVNVTGYASMLKVPFLHLCCSNDSDSSLDAISDLSYRSEDKNVLSLSGSETDPEKDIFYIAPRVDRSFTKEMQTDLELFLSAFLDRTDDTEDTAALLTPNLNFSVSGAENKMYFSIQCEQKLQDVTLYVSHGVTNSAYRNWRTVSVEKAGETEYIGYTEVYSADSPVYAFVSVTTETGFLFSSPVVRRIPSALDISPTTILRRRLIYDSDMGIDDFFSVNKEFPPAIKEGPFGITGICAQKGLCTYKLGDVMFRGSPDGVLQLLLYSPVEQDVTFYVIDDDQFNTYTCVKHVSPLTDWTKIMLSISDFKSGEGVLPGWHRAIYLRIDAESEIVISSLLWV